MKTLFHGSRVEVEYPEIRIQKYHKDFYWGFYCTELEQQAIRWATKFGRAAFWELAKFKYPTHQISFHTARALAALRFERSYVANVQKE